MEQLYKLTREELIKACLVSNSHSDEHIYDPFTDQQLRDLIVNKAVTCYLDMAL